MNSKILSQLSKQQQILYTAMFMDPQMMPSFPESTETKSLGIRIKELFDEGVLSHLSLDEEGCVLCY
jgi:hypothetical protein|tara:strand:+ start:218 stop:418 length:201 start_codon:yes stop_codon:yes gene_type:complete